MTKFVEINKRFGKDQLVLGPVNKYRFSIRFLECHPCQILSVWPSGFLQPGFIGVSWEPGLAVQFGTFWIELVMNVSVPANEICQFLAAPPKLTCLWKRSILCSKRKKNPVGNRHWVTSNLTKILYLGQLHMDNIKHQNMCGMSACADISGRTLLQV